MIQRGVVVFFIYIFYSPVYSQLTNPVGAGPSGMGVSTTGTTIYAAFNNQAGLVALKKISGVVNYENRFLLPEIGVRSFAAAMPVKAGVFAVNVNSFGNKLYSENKYGLAFAKKIGEALSIGIQLDYFSTRIAEGYGKRGVATAEIGVQAKPIKNLIIAAHLFNPTRVQLANYNNERLPTVLKIAGAYTLSSKVIAVVEIAKDIRHKPEFRIGIEYKPADILYLRIGTSTQPSVFSFGMGLQLNDFRLDISSSYHQVLGFSPQLGIVYQMK